MEDSKTGGRMEYLFAFEFLYISWCGKPEGDRKHYFVNFCFLGVHYFANFFLLGCAAQRITFLGRLLV